MLNRGMKYSTGTRCMNVKKVLKLENKILKVRHKTELVKNDVYSTVHIILGERYKDASVRIL